MGRHSEVPLRLLAFFISITLAVAAPSAVDPAGRNIARQVTTTTISFETPVATSVCPNPCGWNGQLCCVEGETCYTDANNQAQCRISPTQTFPSCPLWTTSTQTIETTFSTTVEFVVTYTRTESGILNIIRTASWQIEPRPTDCCSPPIPQGCNYALGETPCGDICCTSGQYCQFAGSCATTVEPPGDPTACDFALGETPCGNVCCVSGQYCQVLGRCVNGGIIVGPTTTSGDWQLFTTTYVETDLQTVTTVYSTFVPTSETLVTVTQTTTSTAG